MVRQNCIVLALIALVSLVTSTPHGYGVKGGAGAVAKAEASAIAGGYIASPPIPIIAASGPGFSGSYSKSSSSSFASSSASSSSSSFSFSGSGANAGNGFQLGGGCSSGSCGCSSGACQSNGANDVQTSNNGDQSKYGTAAQSTSNNNQGIDCSSGQCGNNPSSGCTGAGCPTYENKGIPSTDCTSGNCGQTNSPNDIYVNIPGRSTKNPAEPLKYDVAGYGQNLPNNGKPSSFEPECNSYDCISPSEYPATDDKKRPSSYDVPIFGTTLPNYVSDKKEPCTSPDCQSNDSLNNKPIKPGYNNNLPGPQSTECAGGSCTSQTAAPPKYNPSLKPYTSSYNVPISSSCTGSNCGTPNSVNVQTNKPTYDIPENCGSLGCENAAQPQATNFEYPQSYENSAKSTPPSQNYYSSTGHPNCVGPNCDSSRYQSTNLNTNQPSNTFKYPGNCGTLGCGLTLPYGASNIENQASAKGSVDNSFTSVDQSGCNGLGCSTPSFGNGGAITKKPYFSSPADCGSSDCGAPSKTDTSYSHSEPIYHNSGNSLDNTKCQGAYCAKPSYTNFGPINVPAANCGPSGCTSSGNTGDVPSYSQPGYGSGVPSSTAGQPSPSTSQGWSTQSTVSPSSGYTSSYSGTSHKATSPISSPNTELVPPNENSVVGVNSRPHEETLNNKQNTPGYTSGYGSSSIYQNSVTKPHHESTAYSSSVSSSPAQFPSTPQYSQNTNIPSKPVNGYDKPYSSPKPNKQIYTGGFGAPKGPIDQSIPAKPHVTSTVSPSTQANISPSNIPSASPYKPTNSGSYNQNPIQSSPAPHVTVPQPSVSKDSKKPYTGGFGGPSGFLKPNDYSIPSKLPTPGAGPSITQPNGYSAHAKPSTPTTGASNAVPCTSNNCGSNQSHSTSLTSAIHSGVANAHAQASASAVAYTGGFGGPPGFLKPYDDGKVPSDGNVFGNPSFNLQGANGNLGHSNSYNKNTRYGIHENGSGHTGATAGAQANAVATSSAGAYGLGAGSNGDGVKGCSNGCGAPSGNGSDGFETNNHGINAGAVASAKSVAGSGSYGVGGSFASSSASAHASAGAATKGGYGRR